MKQSSILARLIPHFSESDYSENIFLTWFNNCPPPLLCHTQFTNEIRNVQKQNNVQFFSAEQNTRLKHSHIESISCGASCCSLLWNFAPFGKNPTETKHTWVTTEPYVIACTEEEKKLFIIHYKRTFQCRTADWFTVSYSFCSILSVFVCSKDYYAKYVMVLTGWSMINRHLLWFFRLVFVYAVKIHNKKWIVVRLWAHGYFYSFVVFIGSLIRIE